MLPPTSDLDPVETTEWRDAFASVVRLHGPDRARYLLDQLVVLAHQQHIGWSPELVTPYVNTIAVQAQQPYPGDLAIEEKLGHTFRSPQRDAWPAALKDLAVEFEKGRKIRGDGNAPTCRVCSL